MSQHVLLVDDDPVQRRLLQAQVSRMGYHPLPCEGGAAALAALERDGAGAIAAVVLDLVMPGMSGLDVLAAMRRRGCLVPVVVQTARGGVDTVVEAMRAGAFDFVVKPVSPGKLQATIAGAVRMKAAGGRIASHAAGRQAGGFPEAGSPAMRPVLAQAARAARSNIPVLLEGETGVGKEWLAEAIRAAGARGAAPFVAVNCGALPPQLAESLLFGHEKGAFTDAGERRPGRFTQADGGTLFLDEVGELPPAIQVKLLRVLQSGEIDPVGGRAGARVDVRVISATNRDLAEEVAAGRFRQDLFYRLNAFPIRVPPLRERRAEIAGLAAGFLQRFVEVEAGARAGGFSAAAADLLGRYDWPGNIRQLENVVHRAVVLGEGTLLEVADFPQVEAFVGGTGALFNAAEPRPAEPKTGADDLPVVAPPPQKQDRPPALDAFDAGGDVRPLEDVEGDLIRLALARYGGHMSEAARRLGIGRSTLYRKMRHYDIAEPADR